MSSDTMPCGCEGHADNAGLCRFPALEAELTAERLARQRAEEALRDADGRASDWQRRCCGETARAERAEEVHEALLRRLEHPLGDAWTPPIFLCRTGSILPDGAPERRAEAVLEGFDLRATAGTAGEASAVVMAMLCRELLARLARAEAAVSNLAAKLEEKRRTAAELRRERNEAAQHLRDVEAQRNAEKAARERTEADNAALLKALCSIVSKFDADAAQLREHGVEVIFPEAVRHMLAASHPGAALLERLRALEKVRDAAEPFRREASHYADMDDASPRERMLVAACAAADALKGTP